MGAKFIGYERIAGEKSKKTGQPYDFTKLYCIDDTNKDIVGYQPVEIFLNTEELTASVGKDFFHLPDILNSDVQFTFGFINGKPQIDGFTVKAGTK